MKGGLIQVESRELENYLNYSSRQNRREGTTSSRQPLRGGTDSSIQVDSRGRRGLLQEESREWGSYFNQVFKLTDEEGGDYFKETVVKGGLIQVFK